ncbi:MAG: hypothetical protein HQM12_17025 [SAR324 cluster bacterium]|nr:hypothetical protein [SAR324 cluster bacterium]
MIPPFPVILLKSDIGFRKSFSGKFPHADISLLITAGIILWLMFFPQAHGTASAFEQPMIEAGMGYFEGYSPHYLGSNHYHFASFPFPVLVVRIDRLQAGDNTRLFLFENDNLLLDISLGGRLPVDSDPVDADQPKGAEQQDSMLFRNTNYTRRGMPNRQRGKLLNL